MLISIYISFFIKLYLFSNVYQQSFYEIKNVFKYIVKKFVFLFIPSIFIVLNYIFPNLIFTILTYLAIIFQIVFFQITTIKKLKITKRIIRLWSVVLLFAISINSLGMLFLIDLCCIFIILISNYLLLPIEHLISKKYLKKAINKISLFNGIKIAITGSYGKTSTKNYIYSMLNNKYLVKASPKSYNTPLGISRFINSQSFELVEFVIYEFGARRVSDISLLAKHFKYDIAIVTGIGDMHIDTFKTKQNIIDEKMSILKYLSDDGIAILNYDNEFIKDYPVKNKKYTYGIDCGDYRAKNVVISIYNTQFDLYIHEKFVSSIKLNLLGRQSILNVMPSIILGCLFSVDLDKIKDIPAVDNRLSLRKINDYFILDDAYNSNILGATYALEVLSSHNGIKFLITPGFVEMDKIRESLAFEYAVKIILSVDICILIQNKFTEILMNFIDKRIEVVMVKSFKEAFNVFLKKKLKNSILLIENDLPDAY